MFLRSHLKMPWKRIRKAFRRVTNNPWGSFSENDTHHHYPATLRATQSDGQMEKYPASHVSDGEERPMWTSGMCKPQAPLCPPTRAVEGLRTSEIPYFGNSRFASRPLRVSNYNCNVFFSGFHPHRFPHPVHTANSFRLTPPRFSD